MDAINSRFSGLEIDDSFPAISPSPAPDPTPAPEMSTEAARAAAQAERAVIRDTIGVSLDDRKQFFDTGTTLTDSGLARVTADRREYEALPSVADGGLEEAIAPIKAEDREDVIGPLPGGVDEHGLLAGTEIEPHAYKQLVRIAPSVRNPQNLNEWLHFLPPDARLRRTRKNEGGAGRSTFAVLSASYQAGVSAVSVSKWLEAVAPKTAKVSLDYERESTQWTLALEWAPDFTVQEQGVGRVMRVKYCVRGADNGSRGIDIAWQVVRVRCVNATTIQDEKLVAKHRHTKRTLSQIVQASIVHSESAMRSFSDAWQGSTERAILDAFDARPLDAEECFKRLISHEFVTVPEGTDRETFLSHLMDAYRAENIFGAAGINAAITRAAHEGYSWQDRQALEDQAGSLLYQKVYVLDPMSAAQERSW
jgi:hypothetical protein